jgi:hypothetical protein
VYEHGYNIGKYHQLAIGAHAVEWFDFLLWQSISQEQYIVNRVAGTADLVAIAHPSFKHAYSLEDMRQLTGYELLEVVNGTLVADKVWDAALSTGHAVWAIGDDDTHDVNDPKRTAVAWSMIDAPTTSTSDVVSALRAGRTYAVARAAGEVASLADRADRLDTTVSSVGIAEGRLLVTCGGEPSTFLFVGQNGAVRKTVKGVVAADYAFDPGDTYIRTVIISPRTTMYLNPVLRYDGVHVPRPASTVDVGRTWLLRGSCLMAATAALLLARTMRRVSVPAPAARRALSGAKRRTA